MGYLLGLVVLAVTIWALINVWQSNAETTSKVLWTVGMLIPAINVVVLIFWFFIGPKANSRIA